jgi:hypothetical protein
MTVRISLASSVVAVHFSQVAARSEFRLGYGKRESCKSVARARLVVDASWHAPDFAPLVVLLLDPADDHLDSALVDRTLTAF